MIIDTQTIPNGHSAISQETDLGPFAEEMPPLAGKIACHAEIDRSGQVFYIHLLFKGSFKLECSRCLSPFDFPLSGDLRLVAKEQPGMHGPSRSEESVDFFYDSRHREVDLGPALYDEIMTTLPLKPLCSEECQGIEILNKPNQRQSPGTTGDGNDPRWEALKKLKKQ